MPAFTVAARALLERLESCRLTAYRDSAGILTIGFGHTGGVREGMVWTKDQADAALDADLVRFVDGVDRMTAGLPLTDNQFGALVIFAFDVGLSALAGSTAMRLLRNGHPEAVPDALALWNKVRDGSGVPVACPGLVNRRAAEAQLWNTPATTSLA